MVCQRGKVGESKEEEDEEDNGEDKDRDKEDELKDLSGFQQRQGGSVPRSSIGFMQVPPSFL